MDYIVQIETPIGVMDVDISEMRYRPTMTPVYTESDNFVKDPRDVESAYYAIVDSWDRVSLVERTSGRIISLYLCESGYAMSDHFLKRDEGKLWIRFATYPESETAESSDRDNYIRSASRCLAWLATPEESRPVPLPADEDDTNYGYD